MRFFRRGNQQGSAGRAPAEPNPDPFAVYQGLRGIPLGERGGPAEPFEGTPIVAVILDWGRVNGAVTIAAMADGTTSMYTSTGGGVIGAGAHAPVRDASRRLMQLANEHLSDFASTTEVPIPATDRLAIVIRTTDGLRRAEVSYDEIKRLVAPGQSVFDAANDVLTAIRIATQEQASWPAFVSRDIREH
jgi:hypothetical protein